MLISPVRVHNLLTALLEADEEKGPHTALLITPAGQLLSHATLPEDEDEEGEGEGEGDDAGDDGGEGEEENGDGNGAAGPSSGAADADDDEGEGEDDEPWLEGPERLRLLLGLASQWEEDESPRVECEVSSCCELCRLSVNTD
jgi:hypothetical protein